MILYLLDIYQRLYTLYIANHVCAATDRGWMMLQQFLISSHHHGLCILHIWRFMALTELCITIRPIAQIGSLGHVHWKPSCSGIFFTRMDGCQVCSLKLSLLLKMHFFFYWRMENIFRWQYRALNQFKLLRCAESIMHSVSLTKNSNGWWDIR